MNWQKTSGYTYRALVEVDISLYKLVIGDALRSRTNARRNTEVAVTVQVLNQMLERGRPEYVRTATSPQGFDASTVRSVQHARPTCVPRMWLGAMASTPGCSTPGGGRCWRAARWT